MKNIDFIAIGNAIKAAKAKKNGPGRPTTPAEIKAFQDSMAAKGLEWDPKTNRVTNKVGGKSGKEMQEVYNPMQLKTYQSPTQEDFLTANRDIMRENYMAPSNVKSQGETKISYKRGGEVVPETGEALTKRLIKDGILVEREGTLWGTEKYEKLKREGGLYKYRLAN